MTGWWRRRRARRRSFFDLVLYVDGVPIWSDPVGTSPAIELANTLVGQAAIVCTDGLHVGELVPLNRASHVRIAVEYRGRVGG